MTPFFSVQSLISLAFVPERWRLLIAGRKSLYAYKISWDQRIWIVIKNKSRFYLNFHPVNFTLVFLNSHSKFGKFPLWNGENQHKQLQSHPSKVKCLPVSSGEHSCNSGKKFPFWVITRIFFPFTWMFLPHQTIQVIQVSQIIQMFYSPPN
jgi:hypothetical protein